MSIDRLRYFAAVVETKNLRKASELMGISPPSMSKAISVLESELNLKLLHPDGRGIQITDQGMKVYRSSLLLLEEERRFYRQLKEQSPKRRRLRIASFEVFSSYFIPAFLNSEPDLELLLLEMPPGKIEQAVLSGVVDFGITYIPAPDPGLQFSELGSFQMGIFGLKKWASMEFSTWPFAVPITEFRIQSSEVDSMDMWPKVAPQRKVKYQFELLETALQTSRNGLSVLHCPDFIVKLHNEHVDQKFRLSSLSAPSRYKKAKPTKIYLVSRKNAETKSIEGKLARLVRLLK